MAEQYSTVWIQHILFIHPPLIRPFDFLIPFGYCKKCCYNYSCIKFLFEQLFSIILGPIPKSGIAGPYGNFTFN